jgi:hypothetical protein
MIEQVYECKNAVVGYIGITVKYLTSIQNAELESVMHVVLAEINQQDPPLTCYLILSPVSESRRFLLEFCSIMYKHVPNITFLFHRRGNCQQSPQ